MIVDEHPLVDKNTMNIAIFLLGNYINSFMKYVTILEYILIICN